MSVALRLEDVHKQYGLRGRKALDGLTCSFPTGSISGFVGPNGAGKTTTFSVVSGFVEPDSGVVDVLGQGVFDPLKMKGQVGVLPQDAELSTRHTPKELLVHLARLQGLSAKDARAEADRLLELVLLGDRSKDRIAHLSHGMRRRVAVASALVGSPKLVLLDEPLAGLDPKQARSLREALASLRGIQTLVVSSHNLYELERLCDYVVMIDVGKRIEQGTMEDVTGTTTLVEWHVGSGVIPLDALGSAIPEDTFDVVEGVLVQRAAADLDASSIAIMRLLAEAGVPVREVRRGVGLERRFIDGA